MKPQIKDFVKDTYSGIKDSEYKPIINNILIGAGVIMLIGLSGYVLKVFTFTVRNFKEFQNVMKRQ